ncbi:uncharacterized protein EI90DRAFT_3043838 [Cantharellus anzutake]|uniref:uncharacterized protein n=1 Tax=Cantharellus anzutake TaxID=1750568 RepID=UPI0019081F73|nr:uncharacterized protein EI90DRAFT_3043838 [Cantharellus anzutake]KAF8336847.1 hypothetical protein EI90DRAFT_3043838 [Cantharellus anzutake]
MRLPIPPSVILSALCTFRLPWCLFSRRRLRWFPPAWPAGPVLAFVFTPLFLGGINILLYCEIGSRKALIEPHLDFVNTGCQHLSLNMGTYQAHLISGFELVGLAGHIYIVAASVVGFYQSFAQWSSIQGWTLTMGYYLAVSIDGNKRPNRPFCRRLGAALEHRTWAAPIHNPNDSTSEFMYTCTGSGPIATDRGDDYRPVVLVRILPFVRSNNAI